MRNLHVLCTGLVFTLLFSFTVSSQQNSYKKGTIIVNQKKSIDAFIEVDFRLPQRFQSSITYVSPENYEKLQRGEKIKGKSKKTMKPKDIIGFDLDDGTSFRTVSYTDMSSNSSVGPMPIKLCLQRVVDGKIDLYKMFSATTGNVSHDIKSVMNLSEVEDDDNILIDYVQDNFQLLVQKNEGTVKNLMSVSLLNYFGDNSKVKENYIENQYGFRDEFNQQSNSPIVNHNLEAALLRLLNDYESVDSGQLTK